MEAPDDFDAFYAREWPQLVGTLSLAVGDRALAEELAQETLSRVAARWHRVRR